METAYKKRIARFARRTQAALQQQLEAEKDGVYMPQTPECIGNKNILHDKPMFSTSAPDVEMEIAQALINLSEISDAQTVNANVNKSKTKWSKNLRAQQRLVDTQRLLHKLTI